MCERDAQRSRSVCCGCEKDGNNRRTSTTKVIKSVLVALRQGGTISCMGEKLLCRSVHRIELPFVYCAQSARVIIAPEIIVVLIIVNKFREFNFCCSLVLR